MTWIASLHDFLEVYQIETDGPLAELSWRDSVNALRGGLHARAYILVRERMRD